MVVMIYFCLLVFWFNVFMFVVTRSSTFIEFIACSSYARCCCGIGVGF